MTVDLLPLLLHGVPAGDLLSGTGAVLGWLVDALVWLLDHGLLVALATAAAAGIAWQAHRREESREREREAANDARIEALAFTLIHEVELWQWDPGSPGPPVYATMEERAKYALRAVPSMEERFQEMLALAPESSSEQKERVQKAATAFYSCIGLLRIASRGERDSSSLGGLMRNAHENKDEALLHLTEASESLLQVDLERIGKPEAPR